MNGNNTYIIEKAYNFAKKKYDAAGKLYNDRPYIVHPVKVSEVIGNLAYKDNNLRSAALLHDLLEDTSIAYEELVLEFNEDIASLVREVTKDENNNFPNLKTERGLILKVADRLVNVTALSGITDEKKRKKLFKKYSLYFINEGSSLYER